MGHCVCPPTPLLDLTYLPKPYLLFFFHEEPVRKDVGEGPF